MGLKDMASRRFVREQARREEKDVNDTLTHLHFREVQQGEDHSQEIADLRRRAELLRLAIKSGTWPPGL